MKFDRGMIKWQPFDAVLSSKETVKSLLLEKSKIPKPILSEEEIQEIEEKIINAYFCQNDITLQYYKCGYLQSIQGKIKKIDHVRKMIYLDTTPILFQQIISVHA